ncbi:MAG: hydrogenase maturation protease [Chloroflexi bacterium]|nr:hydrogenase maturation protease [Chloroflexota bacterium]
MLADHRRSPLVVGLGNPLLGDDGVGWQVAELVRREAGPAVEVACLAVGGLRLMERLIGCHQAIIIDALPTGRQPPGTIYVFPAADLREPIAGHCSAVHDTTLLTALRLGRALALALPDEILIVGIEAEPNFDFTETLTPPVAAAVPLAARLVMELLRHPVEEGQAL